ncbi:hypothetical protein [Pseudoalteromonas citrea]|nr:hypothetical protein [Pseudoalteromonas citrea]
MINHIGLAFCLSPAVPLIELIERRIFWYKCVLRDMANKGVKFHNNSEYKAIVSDINLFSDLGCLSDANELSELLSRCVDEN